MSSQDLSPSWRSLGQIASSRIQSYLQPRVGPHVQRAKAWAGQQIQSRRGADEKPDGAEKVNLFPGWAVRRYRIGSDDAFETEVFVSGFAASYRSEENATRSQRAFIRLAKGFAALPKITADAIDGDPELFPKLTPSTEELLAQKHLPPRPTEISNNFSLDDLERQFRHANKSSSVTSSASSSRSSSPDSRFSESTPSTPASTVFQPTLATAAIPAHVLRKLHANLESRVRPFWSTALSNRTVRIDLFASPHGGPNDLSRPTHESTSDQRPVISGTAITGPDGSFQLRFKLRWEELCSHPVAVHIAFGERSLEHDLIVSAQLVPQEFVFPGPSTPSRSLTPTPLEERPQARTSAPKAIRVPISCSPIRVISDIDDTVKLSGVLGGARAVFHNVFVKELEENVIPEMSEFYSRMWRKGVRFHYVSNGPFELLPVINEFLDLSELPKGSIKLRSYGGRSLFNGLLSAPADRKRSGVLEVLEAFPESRFLLIGDTGEQDLELYAELARDRPNQIIAVLVRDVDTGERIDDPTGSRSPSDHTLPAVSGSLLTGRGSTSSSWTSSAMSAKSPSRPPSLRTTDEADELGGYCGTSTTTTDGNVSAPASALGGPPRYTAEPDQMPIRSGSDSYASGMAEQPKPKADGMRLHIPNALSSSVSISGPGSVSPATPGPGFYTSYVPYGGGPRSAGAASVSSATSLSVGTGTMSEGDRKRYALQGRVYMARKIIPAHVRLRVFRDPRECVEVEEVMEREGM